MRSDGLGDEVLRLVSDFGGIDFVSLSIPDRFVTMYGSYEDHCKHVGLTSENLVGRVMEVFGSP